MTDFEWDVLQDIADYWGVGVRDIAPVDIEMYWGDMLQSSDPVKACSFGKSYSKLFPF